MKNFLWRLGLREDNVAYDRSNTLILSEVYFVKSCVNSDIYIYICLGQYKLNIKINLGSLGFLPNVGTQHYLFDNQSLLTLLLSRASALCSSF